MLILDRKVIFLKIPWVASTTVSRVIWEHYGIERTTADDPVVVNLNSLDYDRPGDLGWHVGFARIEGHLGAEIDQFRAFTVIRAPVPRTVSVYRWALQKKPHHPALADFDTFLDRIEHDPDSLPKQARVHARPQVSWLKNRAGVIDPRIKVFHTERLAECIPFFQRNLGFTPAFLDQNVSVSPQVSVSAAAETRIAKLYAEDAALYAATGPDRIALA